MSQTLAQRRAADALAKVESLRSQREDVKDRYADYATRLPAAILTNGLGQAAASELAAGKKQAEHHWLYEHLQSWLCGADGPYEEPDLMKAIVTGDRDGYMQAQAEALAWLEWLKKFAVAYLKKVKAQE